MFDRLRREYDRTGQAATFPELSPVLTEGPGAVLARGYSLTLNPEDQSLIRSPVQVQPGQLILTRLAQGQITSRVESTA